ncbi:MAG: pentapeptide repeat-containing protein, partial [Deltaproteobacteria bacterium]|nr:pentapeptide repeat-containing protein [Deltaproteobacteria bacterium]
MKKKRLFFISILIISIINVHPLFAASPPSLTKLTLNDVTDTHQKNRIFQSIDLGKLDLTEIDLSKFSFHNSSLKGTILKRSGLADVLLVATDLSNSSLQKAEMTGLKSYTSNFIKADMRNAQMTCVVIISGIMTGADLSDAILSFGIIRN